jgi:hypothetical protein
VQQLEAGRSSVRQMRCQSLCNVLTLIASALLKVVEVDLVAARNHIQVHNRTGYTCQCTFSAYRVNRFVLIMMTTGLQFVGTLSCRSLSSRRLRLRRLLGLGGEVAGLRSFRLSFDDSRKMGPCRTAGRDAHRTVLRVRPYNCTVN